MKVQEKIIENYPLINKINCELNCYSLAKRRYLVFYGDLINIESIKHILNHLEEKTNNSMFTEWKTLIVVGKTTDVYKKEELLYFNNVNTFVVFYLINEELNKIFMNDSRIFAIGLNYRKYIKRLNGILNK